MKTATPTQSQDLERTILAAISAQPDIELVIIFGSLATGKADANSDMDLALDVGHPLSADEKMELIAALAGATGRSVDLIDLRTAGEPLLGQVLRHGKRILGKDEHYARLLYRHVLDEADFLPYRNNILAERRRTWIGR